MRATLAFTTEGEIGIFEATLDGQPDNEAEELHGFSVIPLDDGEDEE